MGIIDIAKSIAKDAHKNQKRAHGTDYIDHPFSVAALLKDVAALLDLELSDNLVASALLHDAVEDSALTRSALDARTNDEIAERVFHLTKVARAGESKSQRDERYYATLLNDADPMTCLIKICDRLHNLSELKLTGDDARIARYQAATLKEVLPLCSRFSDERKGLLEGALHFALSMSQPQRHKHFGGLYALINVDERTSADEAFDLAKSVAFGGAQVMQLRAKGQHDTDTLAFAKRLATLCAEHKIVFVVNDRPDIATLSGADFVHVGQHDLPSIDIKKHFSLKTGTSCHTLDDLRNAADANDYVALGPVYESRTKKGHANVTGLAMVQKGAQEIDKPICVIGGIDTPARMFDVAKAGAKSAALISALALAQSPRFEAFRLSLAFAMGTCAMKEKTHV